MLPGQGSPCFPGPLRSFRLVILLLVLGWLAPASQASHKRKPMQIQLRWQLVAVADNPDQAPADEDLYFRRIKFRSNWWISDSLFHHFQFEVKNGDPYLEDAYLSFFPDEGWQPGERGGWNLRLGQFKNPLSRSLISSSSGLPFEDRPLAARVFAGSNLEKGNPGSLGKVFNHGVGRNPGVQVAYKWKLPQGRTLARLQVHGLQGVERSEFDPGHSFVSRLELYPLGDPGYRIGAYQIRRAPRLGLELSFFRDPGSHHVDLTGDGLRTHLDDQRRQVRNLGFHFTRHRFSANGEFFRQWYRPLTAGVPGGNSQGSYVHASWIFRPDRDEVSVRYSEVDPALEAAGDLQEELAFSLTRYFGKVTRKLVLSTSRVRDRARPGLDERRTTLNWFHQF